MKIRCKFRLTSIIDTKWASNSSQKVLEFTTQYDPAIPEDQRFCKATPSGTFRMVVDNPVALGFFELGKDYYFDASEVTAGS